MSTRRFKVIKQGICRIDIQDVRSGKWIQPRRGKRYRADRYVHGSDGKRHREYQHFATFEEAKAFRESANAATPIANVPVEPASTSMTFEELVEQWRTTWLLNKQTPTQVRYQSYLKHFAFFVKMPVERIGVMDVDGWLILIRRKEYLANGHPTRCDYRHEFSVLRSILQFYQSRFNREYQLPFIRDHRSMLKVKEKQKLTKDLSVEEVSRFLIELRAICVPLDLEAVYFVAVMQYSLYCRIQEAAALHWEDFDLERDRVAICRKVQWARSHGFKDEIVSGSKANGGKELPIPTLARSALREWALKSGIRSGPLFMVNGKILRYRQIEYRYTQALKRAGLPFTATHILRHASLSESYSLTKDLRTVQAQAGHADARSTNRYVKQRQANLSNAQSLMDEHVAKVIGGTTSLS
jgi:integrase